MLHDASVLSSHLRAYQPAGQAYASAGTKFFDALHDFLASSGGSRCLCFLLTTNSIRMCPIKRALLLALQVIRPCMRTA
jgi:hypothetical protein